MKLGGADVLAVNLSISALDIDLMATDIMQLIADKCLNPRAYGVQTQTILQDLPHPRWQAFFDHMENEVRALLDGSVLSGEGFAVIFQSWASVLDAAHVSSRDYLMRKVHRHSTSTLSTIFYLQSSSSAATCSCANGTLFFSPNPPSLPGDAQSIFVEAEIGRLVIFPSWLFHSPCVETCDKCRDGERIVVATDIYLLPSNCFGQEHDRQASD